MSLSDNLVEENNGNQQDDHLSRLIEILENPERRILPLILVSSLSTSNKNQGDNDDDAGKLSKAQQEKSRTLKELIGISKELFADIESLGNQYQELLKRQKKYPDDDDKLENVGTREEPHASSKMSSMLSGLTELFIPPDTQPNDTDLPETIFGQVDLQNSALQKLMRKSTKRLAKSTENICVLDMDIMASDDNESDGIEEEEEEDQQGGDNFGSESDDEEEDEETRRMRKRMEQAMEDMEDEDEGEEDEEEENKISRKKEKKEDLYDPIAEEMKDGFFDLNEMEAFADEEEDYLPEESFDEEKQEGKYHKKGTPKKSFHQRQREGEMDYEDSDDEGDEMDELYEEPKNVKRKQYRDEEDIEALYNLYQVAKSEDDIDDAANMTAADFFGAPQKKYIERYKKNHPQIKQTSGDADDDSWGDYDFEKEDEAGWRDDDEDENRNTLDGSDDYDEEDHDDNECDEDEMGDEEVGGEDESGGQSMQRGSKLKLPKQQEKLRRQTEELEKELLSEKPWQMTGETKSFSRPVNSLLEGTPEFEMASKQAPTITVEHTANLEDVIKKRILAEDWDDVVPRELPDIGWNKKRGEAPEVSQEKSKLGLGELYEREYLKKAVGYDKDAVEKQTEEDKAKDEMKQLFANLCSKLDALSNYHFAPRPIAEEAEVRPVTAPAIAMEEVLPLHVSDARGVAPEEVYATKRGREGILRADSEMDQNDRKRKRQSKKAARRKARKEKQADEKLISRLQPGLGLNNPYEKRKAREELAVARSRGKVTTGEQDMDSKFGSSGTFFKRLQAEAQQTIKASSESDQHTEKKSKAKSSAYKL